MKSMLDKSVRVQMISRVNNMTPDAKALWGKMTPDQAIRHINRAMAYSLGDFQIPYKGSPIMSLMKPLILRLPIPRAKFETFAEMKVTGSFDLEAEKKQFIELANRYGDKPKMTKQPISPLLGKMSVNEWGLLDYSHTHHHLSQFGL